MTDRASEMVIEMKRDDLPSSWSSLDREEMKRIRREQGLIYLKNKFLVWPIGEGEGEKEKCLAVGIKNEIINPVAGEVRGIDPVIFEREGEIYLGFGKKLSEDVIVFNQRLEQAIRRASDKRVSQAKPPLPLF